MNSAPALDYSNPIFSFLGDMTAAVSGFWVENEKALKGFLIFASLLALAGIVYAAVRFVYHIKDFRSLTWRDFLGIGQRWSDKYMKIWREVEKDIGSGEKHRMRRGLAKADQAFFDLLGVLGYKGESFEERTRSITTDEVSNMDTVRRAHQFVINIGRNVEKDIPTEEADKVLGIYRQALEDLYNLRK